MRFAVICVRDSAVETFSPPGFYRAIGEAERAFSDEVNSDSKESMLAKHPDDFELYQLGWFESDNGSFELFGEPQRLARGKDLKKGSVN